MPNAVSDLVIFDTVYTLHANSVTSPLLTQLTQLLISLIYTTGMTGRGWREG